MVRIIYNTFLFFGARGSARDAHDHVEAYASCDDCSNSEKGYLQKKRDALERAGSQGRDMNVMYEIGDALWESEGIIGGNHSRHPL